jgi:hypothetical protein
VTLAGGSLPYCRCQDPEVHCGAARRPVWLEQSQGRAGDKVRQAWMVRLLPCRLARGL